MIRSLGTRVKNNSSNFAAVTFETPSLPTLRRCYRRSFYLDRSHCLVLAPATLAALPSTRAIPDRDVFYVTHPIDSFAPALSPSRGCPSMSRLPSTPHSLHLSDGNDGCAFDERRLGLVGDRLGQKR